MLCLSTNTHAHTHTDIIPHALTRTHIMLIYLEIASEKESAPSFVTYLSSFTGERAYQLDLQSCGSELLTSTLESSACGSKADRFTSEIDEWANTNESL